MSREHSYQGRWIARMARAYRLSLLLFPPAFRARYGAEMTRIFREASGDAYTRRGWTGMVAVWFRQFAELVTRGPRERLASMGHGAGQRRRHGRSGGGWIQSLLHDVRYAVRTLGNSPTFAAVAIATLALGVGANSAIFSVVNGVVLRPLPYAAPGELVAMRLQFLAAAGDAHGRGIPASEPEYLELRDQASAFVDIAGYWIGRTNVGGLDEPQRVPAPAVSANFLDVVGVAPMLGRGFVPGEDLPGADRVVILAHGFWQRSFGGDSAVVGRSILVDGRPATVIGVLPASFEFPGAAVDLLRINDIDPQNPMGRSSHYLEMIGRLRPGLSVEGGRAETRALVARWNAEFPNRHGPSETHPYVITALHDHVVGDIRPTVLILTGAVALVLLIACANVANLLFARAESRQAEIGLRIALGAGRRRLVRQLLTESAVLGVLGGALGLGVAFLGVRLLMLAGPGDLPRVHEIRVDGLVLAFTAVISLLTAFVFGLMPALAASRTDVNGLLRSGAVVSGGGKGRLRLRRGLVVAEVALAVVLVVGAGLLAKSFLHLRRVDPGFATDGVVTMDFFLSSAVYPEMSDVARFHADLVERVEALPGVVAAGAIRSLPLYEVPGHESITLVGRELVEGEPVWNAQYQVAGPGYFEALEIPLLAGRRFTERDREGAQRAAIVNETMAKRFWPNGDALGEQIQLGRYPGNNNPLMTIVGVVGDVLQAGLDGGTEPQFFAPRQQAGAYYGGFATRFATLVVKAQTPPPITMSGVRGMIRALDPDLPLSNVQTMERVVARSISDERFLGVMMGTFSAVALLLGAVGVYGLMAYTVARRSREIGLRIALGADRRRVLGLVVRQGLTMTVVGAALGMGAALATGRVVASFLFEVGARDPVVFAAAPVVLLVVAILAAYVPARRAAGVDPVEALRVE